MIPKGFIFIYLSLISILKHHTVLAKDTETNAFIYEKDAEAGNMIEYGKTMTEWNDLPNLLHAEGLMQLGLLCVTGAFLLYKQADFDALDESQMRLYSGKNTCISPGWVDSIQLATGFGDIFKPTLSIFPETMLRGHVFPVSATSYDAYKKVGNAESLIIFGKKGFTLKTTMTKRNEDPFCLMPVYPDSFKFPICFLSSFRDQPFSHSKEFNYISPGCTDKSKQVPITNCLDFGNGDFGDDEDKNEIDDNSPIKGCDDNEEFLSLLDLRLNNDFGSHYQMRYPKDKRFFWRTGLVDSAFDVVIGTCSKERLNTEFLAIIREMFIYLIENKIWSKEEGEKVQNRTDELDMMVLQVDVCAEHLKKSSVASILIDSVSTAIQELDANKTIFDIVRPEFKTVKGYDLIMETMWYVGNLATSICHVTTGTEMNFWTDFYLMFWESYLKPLMDHGKNPERFLTYYPVLFGGYGVEEQINSLALCASYAFEMSHLEPYPRPAPDKLF